MARAEYAIELLFPPEVLALLHRVANNLETAKQDPDPEVFVDALHEAVMTLAGELVHRGLELAPVGAEVGG